MAILSRLHRTLAGALLAGAVLSTPAQALEPAEAIQTRKAVMTSIGAHMNGIKAGMAAKNGKAIAGHAGAIAALAPILPSLFPGEAAPRRARRGPGPKSGSSGTSSSPAPRR